ncbi:hypothetical protein L218DRAFT_955752 [Marasmius fiardii PR-910]|nr:hypothetical protein L218DRAFT_955752 [Marasmius fiardii PR-910]
MSNGSAPELTISTHFDNPARPRPEFTPTPFDTEHPTGIPLVFNKDDYPPLDGKLWKDYRERLWKEEDRVDTESKRIKRALQDFEDLKEEHEERKEGRKAAYEADLESWEQEEEIRQQKWVDYIAHAQCEVEERKREEQCGRRNWVSATSCRGRRGTEEPEGKGKGEVGGNRVGCVDYVKYDTTCHVLASGRARACKKRKSKCSNTSRPSSTLISADEESLRKTMEEGLSDVIISNETQMDLMEEKVDKIVSLLAENLEVQKRKSFISASDSAG